VAAVPSVRVVKSFEFKGGLRLWSNRYHFLGGTPSDAAHWHTLTDAITTAEKACMSNRNEIVEAICYAAGSDVPVASKVYSVVGTSGLAGTAIALAGESCGLIRYSTAARTTKNHPIYCFNYMHGVYGVNTSNATIDDLDPTIRANMATYAAAWIAGFSDGVNTYTRSSPNGAACTGSLVEEFVTHRDFPYTSSV
jgi:hypothetical protein